MKQNTYAKIEQSTIVKYPYTIEDLKIDFPEMFSDNVSQLSGNILVSTNVFDFSGNFIRLSDMPGILTIYPSDPPEVQWDQNAEEELPAEKYTGVYCQQWKVVPASEEEKTQRTEKQAIEVRKIRNDLVAATDWTQGKDIAQSVSETWQPYRQQLRDITEQAGFPWTVVWPVVPVVNE
ncbi:Phage tail assembly chaperone protein [uncultured Caudovirales phage]|uniref:Phage tail assembly chaperone protein n=1 Tax=uncultured Caudovirales phage TaxID=2100421 RepID=A0A6J5LWV6_9CAUD|nr:Phage tail assembly chaperone protein [uncultured Caudovirales phage]